MPTPEGVRDFISRVELKDYVGSIVHFYHEDASMQERIAAS
jgi:hypothetical protein